MNIMMLGPDYPPVVYGGVGVHIRTLSRELVKCGHRVVVVCLGNRKIISDEFYIREDEGVKIIEFTNDIVKYDSLIGEPWDFRVMYNNTVASLPILDMIKQYDIDIVHVHDHFWAMAIEVIKSKIHIPMVVTLHSISSKENSFQDILRRYLYHNSEKVIGISHFMCDQMKKRYGKSNNVELVYNGIEVDYNSIMKNKHRFRICFCGRITSKKGVDILIDALLIVREKIPQIELMIVGTGDEEDDFKKKVKMMGIDEHVHYTGFISPDMVEKTIGTGVISVVPSRYEALGLSAIEAMKMGNCVIASNVGGLPEIVEDGRNGVLFNDGSYTELAEKIIELLENDVKRMLLVEEGYQSLGKFSSISMTNSIERIYNQIISARET